MPIALKIILLVVAAIALAVVARLFYVAQNTAPPLAEAQIRVRVAATDLPAGLLIRDEDLAWTTMPISAVPANAITERSRDSLEGALLRRALPAGTVLSSQNILSPESPGFLAAALPPGSRAVSIPVNEVSGNAGLIRPGDHIDLILTQDLRGRTSSRTDGSVVSETIVQNARVIAVGGRIQGNDGAPTTNARTVTLQVPPRAAEIIAVASRLGTLSLALRSFAISDRDQASSGSKAITPGLENQASPVWASDVSQALETLTTANSLESAVHQEPTLFSAPTPLPQDNTPRTVTIMRGASTSSGTWQPPARAPEGVNVQADGSSNPAQSTVGNSDTITSGAISFTRNLGNSLGLSLPALD